MYISYTLNIPQRIAGTNRWLVVIFAVLCLASFGMVSYDAFATSPQSSWCSLYHMDLGEISDDSFLAYLHFCTKQAPTTSNTAHHNSVQKQSSMQTNSPNAQSSMQTNSPNAQT